MSIKKCDVIVVIIAFLLILVCVQLVYNTKAWLEQAKYSIFDIDKKLENINDNIWKVVDQFWIDHIHIMTGSIWTWGFVRPDNN